AGTATLGGNLIENWGAPVTERGVVLSPVTVNAKPFLDGAGVIKLTATGTGTGSFTANAAGLAAGTTYAFKAFATHVGGTGYSEARVFTTAGGAVPDIVVTTDADENDSPAGSAVSLREAVRDAAPGAKIGFAPELDGHVFLLAKGEIAITGTITVDASRLINGIVIDAAKRSRHFKVAAGASLALNKLTLQSGMPAPVSGTAQPGGAILSLGALTLTDCVLNSNQAGSGSNGQDGAYSTSYPTSGGPGTPGAAGGAISTTANLTAVRCRFLSNQAGHGGSGGQGGSTSNPGASTGACGGTGASAGSGGAISSAGTLALTDCLFESNKAGAGGSGGSVGYGGNFSGGGQSACGDFNAGAAGNSGNGGAVSHEGPFTATGCTFSQNVCYGGGFGGNRTLNGGVYGQGGSAGSGGAIFTGGGDALFVNCTVSGNLVQDGYIYGGSGGGLYFKGTGASLRLVHCTVTGNKGDVWRIGVSGWGLGSGGGVSSEGPAQFDNCLIAGNVMARGPYPPAMLEENTGGSGVRTFTPATPFPNAPSTVVDPLLTVLSVSGGALSGHTPKPGSPALNAGTVIAGAPGVDQRGLPR
ncbi:MAG TPA: choice-of-anchor Q domain-containing protein, partial [Verrucomicrobiales bacterium]|nr:choice-of-anchor Q domain-containing protein [Verrucomicrobiales bacterium]